MSLGCSPGNFSPPGNGELRRDSRDIVTSAHSPRFRNCERRDNASGRDKSRDAGGAYAPVGLRWNRVGPEGFLIFEF